MKSRPFSFLLLLPNLSPSLRLPSSHPLIAEGALAVLAVEVYTDLCVYVSDYSFTALPVFSPPGA